MSIVDVRPYAMATDGTQIVPQDLAHTYTYDASGNLLTDTVVHQNGNSYRKTYTWTSNNPVTESAWVKV